MMVFAVRYREAMIDNRLKGRIHKLIIKIINDCGLGSEAICVDGTEDHIHILLSLSPKIAIADLAREIKSRSSRWVNEQRIFRCQFAWQEGYGVFSYSQSAKKNVVEYIMNQEEHHRKRGFKEEFLNMIDKYELISDPRDMPYEPKTGALVIHPELSS